MEARSLLVVGLLVATFSLAGCLDGEFSNGPDGQSASASGSVAYNGYGSGTQTSEPFQCDGTGKVQWSANSGGGSITVKVQDGTGAVVYSETFSSYGQTSRSDSVSGEPGQWSLKVTRSNYSGQYAAEVDC